VAADELESDSDCSSHASDSGTPIVINVDEEIRGERVDLFPRSLIKRQLIDRLRPQPSLERRGQPVPPINIPSTLPNGGIRVAAPPVDTAIYSQRPASSQYRQIKERVKVIQPPPMYIKAPPPKTRVMVVKEPPKVIQTPPQIIR